jgi:hypothetical protein
MRRRITHAASSGSVSPATATGLPPAQKEASKAGLELINPNTVPRRQQRSLNATEPLSVL